MNNLFTIDHLSCAKLLTKEALKLKKYKAMHPVLAVFTGIFMLPFILMAALVIVNYVIIAYLRNVCASPIRALHGLVNSEGKEVRHAPQTVIYFISWPTIFLLYFMEAIMIPLLTISYTLASICVYICTLGGVKFNAMPENADKIDMGEVKGRYLVLPIVYISVCALLFIVMLIHFAIDYANWSSLVNNSYYYYYYGGSYSFQAMPAYIGIYMAFSAIYSIIGFARHPKEKK